MQLTVHEKIRQIFPYSSPIQRTMSWKMFNWKSDFYLQLPKIVSKGSPKTPKTQSNFWFRGHFDFLALVFASSSSNSSLADWFFQSIVMICSVSFSDYFLPEVIVGVVVDIFYFFMMCKIIQNIMKGCLQKSK